MTIPEIQKSTERYLRRGNVGEALDFAQKLETSLKTNDIQTQNPEAFRLISQEAFRLYVFALPQLPGPMVERIVVLNIIQALQLEFPGNQKFVDRLEKKYEIFPEEFAKEYLRDAILPLLKKNTQALGTQSLEISRDIPNAKQNVQNWLQYYDRKVGQGKTTSLDRSRFFSTDPFVQNLSAEEKINLRNVIAFYDYLKSDEFMVNKSSEEREEGNGNPDESSQQNPSLPNATRNQPLSTEESQISATQSRQPRNISSPETIKSTSPIPNTPRQFVKKSNKPITLVQPPEPLPANLVDLKKLNSK